MQDIDLTPLVTLVLGFIGRDIVPWCGARMVELANWCGPRIDTLLNAFVLVFTTRYAKSCEKTCKTNDTAPPSPATEKPAATRDEKG